MYGSVWEVILGRVNEEAGERLWTMGAPLRRAGEEENNASTSEIIGVAMCESREAWSAYL